MEEKRMRSERDVERHFGWEELLKKNKIVVVLGIIGLFLVGASVLTTLFFYQQKEPEIEIISSDEETGTIWVDLAGAVVQPGVYELPGDSRLKDLLARAGGLSESADRGWVEKNMNQAEKLVDGQKVFIPTQAETDTSGAVAGEASATTDKININTTSAAELDTLWGIGEARASSIIENRPYSSIDELLDKKIVPSNVFERIKDKISVY